MSGNAPAPVTSLTLQSNGSQDSLKAAWIPAVGYVESYQLSLSPSISSEPDLTLPPNTTQWVFSGLTPGKAYQVLVKTKSGELTAETMTTGRTAPGLVAHLKLEALNEKTLWLSWSPPAGDWDFYRVLLFNDSSVLMNQTIDRNLVEFSFTKWALIPGRLYGAAVVVESGYLSSTSDCNGRLAPRSVQRLNIRHSTETSLSAAWNRPFGEWDNYTVLLKDGDTTVDTRTRELFVVFTAELFLFDPPSYGLPVEVHSCGVSNQCKQQTLRGALGRCVWRGGSLPRAPHHDSCGHEERSVPPNVTSYHFQGLRSGALYRTVVTTEHRGHLSRQMVADGRKVIRKTDT
ncbi:hypothetical protein QQF64_023520, partial [Cirrhinus molitorella]